MRTIVILRSIVAACLWLSFTPSLTAQVITYGSNLIVNPGAESGSDLGGGQSAISGWAIASGPVGTDGFTGQSWFTTGGVFPTYNSPGPLPLSTRGNIFFYGGNSSTISGARQTASSPSLALVGDIDAGRAAYDLNGWLGGYSTQEDNAVLGLLFLNASGGAVGTAAIGPVTAADRSGVTGMLFRQTKGIVPVGTRSIQITLTMTRLEGINNDGYADNLSLILTPVPEPSSTALIGMAFGASRLIATWRRRAAARKN